MLLMALKAREWKLNLFRQIIWLSCEIGLLELLNLATSGADATVAEYGV